MQHEVFSWLWAALCGIPVRASSQKPWLLWHLDYTGVASWLCYMRYVMASYCYTMVMLWLLLWLLCQPGERLCYGCYASQERINVSAFLWLLESSFSPLACVLPTLGSMNSVNSKTIDITNRISDIYIYIYISLKNHIYIYDFFKIHFHYRLLQDNEYKSLGSRSPLLHMRGCEKNIVQ